MINALRRLRARLNQWSARRGRPLTGRDRRLRALENRHAGERAFILGMGPSLKTTDLPRLENEITFACNKIYLALEEVAWRPTYYTVVDVLVAENNRDAIEALDLPMILPANIAKILPGTDPLAVYGYSGSYLDASTKTPSFKKQVFDGIYSHGYTVIFDQLQLAYLMGITEVYILGLDFSFSVPKTTTGETCLHGEVLQSEGEINHFHRDYRKPGETWTMPRLDGQEAAFRYAKAAFEDDGRRIVNASRATKLEVFECADFESLF